MIRLYLKLESTI